MAVETGLIKVREPPRPKLSSMYRQALSVQRCMLKFKSRERQYPECTLIPVSRELSAACMQMERKTIAFDIAFGSSFFALVDADRIGS